MWWQADDSSEESVSSEEAAEIPEDDIDKWIEEREAGIDAERAEEHAEMASDEIDLLIEMREAAIDAERAQQYAEMTWDEFDALIEEREVAIDEERAQQWAEMSWDPIDALIEEREAAINVERAQQYAEMARYDIAENAGGSNGIKRRRLRGKQRVERSGLPTFMQEVWEGSLMQAEDKKVKLESLGALHADGWRKCRAMAQQTPARPAYLVRREALEEARRESELKEYWCDCCKEWLIGLSFEERMRYESERKRLCKDCQHLGYSPKDCREYNCSGGHSCGHLFFDPQKL